MTEAVAESSSSSPAEGSFGRLLRRAFEAIAAEAPVHAEMLREVLPTVRIRLHVGSEVVDPSIVAQRSLGNAAIVGTPQVIVHATPTALRHVLLDGRRLADVARGPELQVRGALPHLREAARLVQIVIHGLARTRGWTTLLADLERVLHRDLDPRRPE